MANYSIRGVGQGLVGGATVTSYFAEAPFGPTGPSMPFFDIASVQVLKGPQGTLFGRATVAGAVLVQPNAPTSDSFYGSVNGKFGNLGRSDLNVMFNVPVIAVTAHGTEGFQRAAYDVGVSGYLTKPIDFNRMHTLIARLLVPG